MRLAMLAGPPLLMSACASQLDESTAASAPPPIACTLSPDQLRERGDALLPGLMRRAESVTDLPNGLRLRFASRDGLLTELATVMEQERLCCRFLHFQLTADSNGGPVTLDVTGPPGTREVLRSLS
jgi:hypothetical protein